MTCPDPTPIYSRRLFWATQANACGTTESCGEDCGKPGLVLNDDGVISTDNWLRGLIINMLMTDGRRDPRVCGYRPGGQGGHWSESFDTGPAPGVGTLLRDVETGASVVATQNLVQAQAQVTLQRLVARGVASDIQVTGEYIGGGRFGLRIVVQGVGDSLARVGLTGDRLENGWVWT